MKEFFNRKFEDVFSQKQREMNNVLERNARLRHIISELNFFASDFERIYITIEDPEWSQKENLPAILKVENKEVDT